MLSLEDVLSSLDEMSEMPSVENFICVLQKCRKQKDLAHAWHVHAHICHSGLEAHSAVGNYIVPMFVECGSLVDAQQVFSRLSHRNEHSWTSLISGYIKSGRLEHAFNLYEKMQEHGVHPSGFTLVALLKVCALLKDIETAQEIHIETAQKGFERDLIVGNTLISMYTKCGLLSEASEVFDMLPVRDVVSWNALITGYSDHGPGQEALKCYELMQLEAVSPDSVTFINILKACGSLRALDKGREIHMGILGNEFERYPLVCNTLVDMYAKCGSLSEAQRVFDELPVQDAVSWNALCAGYVDHGSSLEAIKCFREMQVNGICPTVVTFIWLIRACCSMRTIERGRDLYIEITKQGFERDESIGNILVSMYANCGSLSEAWEILAKLPVQDVLSWNALISGYAEQGPCQGALTCFEQMQLEGVSLDLVTFICVLKACNNIRYKEKCQQIHMDITKHGFERGLLVGNALVDMYAKCRTFLEAHDVFENLPARGIVSWTSLIAGYMEQGLCQDALKCFEEMQLEGVSPNAVTFVCVLKACGSIRAIDIGCEIHLEIIIRGWETDVLVSNALVSMYAKCNAPLEACDVFDKISHPDVVSWNTLIVEYGEHGLGQEAFECYERMQLEGMSPDAVTLVSLLKACSGLGAIEKGRRIHVEMTRSRCEIHPCIDNALVDMYSKCGVLSEAQEVLNRLTAQDTVCWNSLIAGFVEHGPAQEAIRCFEQMQRDEVSPDSVTFVCIMKLYCRLEKNGREMHADITQRGLESELFVGRALVGLYAKCGSLSEAQEVFDKMPTRETVLWTSIIAGYAEHGPYWGALECFEQMQLEGLFPDAMTFVCVLKACSNMRALDKGQEIHMRVVQEGFEGNIFVSNTLVDMYAKCGSLSESKEVFAKLPIRDVVSWNALIGGHTEHGPGQEALKCFQQMQLECVLPDSATVVSVLKACGSIGAIDKGREIHMEIPQTMDIDPLISNTLIDMYAKSGSLLEAQEVFDRLPAREVVSWTALIAGYAIHDENMAIQHFQDMQEHGVHPNAVTFTCLLTACSHANLVFKGQEYFMVMRDEYGISPTVDHYTCIVNLLAQSGYLYEAEKCLETMVCPPSEGTWRALLTGCKTYGEAELGLKCFQELVQMNSEDASSYVLLANIYASADRWDDVYRIEELRKHSGVKKKLASAWIEVNKTVHEFMVGKTQSKEVSAIQESLSSRIIEGGHVPNLDLVLRTISDGEKGATICEHAGKFAMAFGLLNTPEGQIL